MHSKDAEEARRIFNTYGKYYNKLEERNPNRKYIDQILFSMMKDVKGKKILDAGCGSGNYCKILADMGAEVAGIDISPGMIDLAKERCKDYKIDFWVSDIENTRFEDNEFDIVISAFSLLYKKNLRSVLKEFKRLLKKDGEVYIVIPHPIRKMMKYTNDYFETGRHWQNHGEMSFFNYYRTVEEYINTLTSEGFSIKEIREPKPIKTSDNFFPHYLIIKSVSS